MPYAAKNNGLGSPPRMRGKDSAAFPTLPRKGITPACAGKRLLSSMPSDSSWDHPRVCGEKPCLLTLMSTTPGSPPRVRGKEVETLLHFNWVGITPAYAGKRVSRSPAKTGEWDHPRVCGEKARTLIVQDEPQGSPPRVRGKEWYLQGESPAPGITPAYAGKSGWRSCCPGCNRDHPRVCGEKSQPAVRRSCAKGSPPRVRGKGVQSCNERVAVGITPAYAGKSWGRARTSSRRRDHPRVCGEKSANFSHLLPP